GQRRPQRHSRSRRGAAHPDALRPGHLRPPRVRPMTTPVNPDTYYGPSFGALLDQDPEIAGLLVSELDRQRSGLQLIASENQTSPAVLAAVGSTLSNKYAEGYPDARYYGGCSEVDKVEKLAIERARSLFGADHANVQAHSGASANQAVYGASASPA